MNKTKTYGLLLRRVAKGFSYVSMALCGALTVYIFAASFETVFNRNLPVVGAVSSVDLAPAKRLLAGYKSFNQNDVGNYGRPQYLKLPNQDVKMVLAPIIEVNSNILARANTAHFALTSAPKNGNLGDAVAYYRKSWRTNDHPEQTQVGDNIFIDTDRDWRYFYRVVTIKRISTQETYVAQNSSTSQLSLIASDEGSGALYIAQASLVNVQNVRL